MTRNIIFRALLVAVLSLSVFACSQKGTESPASVSRTMPDQYSRVGVETLETLASYIPERTSVAVFSSYGSITEFVKSVQQWDITNREEFEKTLNDLGTHYKLNPAKLRSFYDAGFDTSSGFGVGVYDNRVIVAAKTLDSSAVIQWFENFSNEEFGRPTSDVSSEDGWTYTHIVAMNKELATLCQQNDITLLVFGNGNSDDSTLNAAKNIVTAIRNGATLKNSATKYKSRFGKSPIVAIAPDSANLPYFIPQRLQKEIRPFITSGGLELSASDNALDVHTYAALNAAEKRVQNIKAAFGGRLSPWASPIVNLKPPAAGRMLFDPQGMLNFVFSITSPNVKNSWNSLTGKLNQRLLGINFEQQVFKNLAGSAWVSLYAINSESIQSANSTLSKLLDQDIAVYLPLNDAKLAMQFFGKIAILQKLIPPDLATVETADGILHIIVKYMGRNIHVSYADGLIGVATASGWPRFRKFYANPDQKQADGILMDQKNIAAANVLSAPAANAIVSLCGSGCAFLKPFVARLQNAQASSALEGDTLSADVHLQFGKP